MRLLGTIFAFIFALIAVPLFMFAACNSALMAAYLNRDTYDSVLEDDVIFEEMLSVALPAIFRLSEEENVDFDEGNSPVKLSEIIRALPEETWEEIANLLVPPQWLQTNVRLAVDVLFSVSEGDIDAINQEVELGSVRQRFMGEEASQAANRIILESPTCSRTQEDQLRSFLVNGDGSLPICNPSDEALEAQSIAFLIAWFNSIGELLEADTVSFAEFFEIQRDNAQVLYLFVELDRQGLLLLYLCPMAFLSIVIIFSVRSLKSFGRWLGLSTIGTGISILLLIFGLQVILFNIIAEILQTNNEVEAFFARLFSSLLRSAAEQANGSLLLQAAVFIALGFILLSVGWYVGRGHDDDEDGEIVVITDDGQIISTASQRRLGDI